ncbi:TetR/AcrR family transcriptional regulator [Saccharobesus litoralis]|uniref:TetR/AcrR family transcriptional regulator n=1 Tax=Saccharobesus litoralis TaxID=2172099 RepID=A0A2S0VQQ0_9ALTE|nr:TetR/AcrR family transcriptional regulator [Saccharobesus litoralis]AWB66541.1 TetR/AcrR family transcriptional regulator [Saccharobesus litoralis]
MGYWLKHIKKLHAKGECPLSFCSGSQRKQQKIAEREEELITLAHELVDQVGFAGLTMDKLVKQASCSKGTIYNHFSSKEDLISALSLRSLNLVIDMFNKASKFEGNSREKALARGFAYFLYSQLEPTLFMCVLTAKTPAVMEKSSPERLASMIEKEAQCTAMCDQMFEDGLADGSLKLSSTTGVADLTFAMWAMTFGTNALIVNARAAKGIDRLEIKTVLLRNMNIMCDGMNWLPLSSEFDYTRTWQRLEDYFSEYIELLDSQ